MLSKSKGLILRVAAVIHAAFHLESPHEIPKEISQEVLEAAQDFDMCCQHAAFMAGRGEIADVIQQLQTGLNNHILGISVQKKLHTYRPHTIGLHVVFESVHTEIHRDTKVKKGSKEACRGRQEEVVCITSPFLKTLR